MPIRFKTGPKNGLELVSNHLFHLSQNPSQMTSVLADFYSLEIKPPHAVYELPPDEFANGGGMEVVRNIGFRYLVESSGKPVAAVQVHTDPVTKKHFVAHVNFGRFVEASSRAFDELDTLYLGEGSHEARFLDCPFTFVAIWLKHDTGDNHIIYPLAPTPSPLQADTTYPIEHFLANARPFVQERLKPMPERHFPSRNSKAKSLKN